MKRNLYKLTIGACMFIAILMSTSCNKRLKHAIAIARDNSSELKVVLKHFESDPNPLKYKAAKFLIENMPSQFQIEGNTVDIIDSIYVRTGNVSLNVRTKYFEDSMQGILPDNFDATYDISTIKAEYLIKAIDNACDAWSSSTWHLTSRYSLNMYCHTGCRMSLEQTGMPQSMKNTRSYHKTL